MFVVKNVTNVNFITIRIHFRIVRNVNVLLLEQRKAPHVTSMVNAVVKWVMLVINVTLVTMDISSYQTEFVKNATVHSLEHLTTPVMPKVNVFAREDLLMEPNVTNVSQGFSTFQIVNLVGVMFKELKRMILHVIRMENVTVVVMFKATNVMNVRLDIMDSRPVNPANVTYMDLST